MSNRGEVRGQDITPVAWKRVDEELRANDVAVIALADGRRVLASGGDDGAAHVWDARDGGIVRSVLGHSEWVLSVALTQLPSGAVLLATGGKDGLARIWGAKTGSALRTVTGHGRAVNSVAWASPPGREPWLVTGSDDATVRVWDANSGAAERVFPAGTAGVDLVWSVATALSPAGEVHLTAATDDSEATTVHIWNATTGTKTHALVVERDGLGSAESQVAVATLPDGSLRVAAIVGAAVRLWDGRTGQVMRTLSAAEGSKGDVAVAVAPDGRLIIAATRGEQTRIWDADTGILHATLVHGGGYTGAMDMVALPDGALLLATAREADAPARLWRVDLS
ncbi:WD40 repeat domain-containing protein [Streptomyces sp. DG2A-72]|uniref:WD40 repeat domain-containing protein n=1 Tax=Streptomyces sp. DG2A-72 TaxID=3051386 RepID=UPI00265B87A8|nr:WD40 repeat domain-containing protein [Streptomyces sp. DG2A-72]MDO0934146.1 WD40 repeat domain-containing protein [Streptomyces sp. DG2A-72]